MIICVKTNAEGCPQTDVINPCYCRESVIYCDKVDIRSIHLNLGEIHFKQLSITGTSINSIDDSLLGKATFDSIVIENNVNLIDITPNALGKGPNLIFSVKNNPKLSVEKLFALVKNLEITQFIDFSRNNLVEITDNAFRLTGSKLKSIKLDYNQISKVGSNAFNDNPALINIILSNNNLTENSFSDESFSLENRPENRVNLYLRNNLLKKLRENTFKKFMNNGMNTIDAMNNKFECDCDMKWLTDQRFKDNVQYVNCDNFGQKSVVDLSDEDIKCVITTPTTLPTTSSTTPSTTPTTSSTISTIMPTTIYSITPSTTSTTSTTVPTTMTTITTTINPKMICPIPEDITQCNCVELTLDIFCSSQMAKEINLQKLKPRNYSSLHINGTMITELSDRSLGDAIFKEIHIENNRELMKISLNLMKNRSEKFISIKNNSKLISSELFSVAKSLVNTEILDLSENSLLEIPQNAFNSELKMSSKSQLKNLILSNSKIKRIGSNAFESLPHLTLLELDNNLINKIDDNAFQFSIDSKEPNHKLVIILNKNKLETNSFTENTFRTQNNISISLHLQNNLLTKLSEKIFRPFVANSSNELKLFGNKFECDCDMKWLLDTNVSKNIYDVLCHNKGLKSIYDLKITDLECV